MSYIICAIVALSSNHMVGAQNAEGKIMVISFISMGAGIDQGMREAFDQFLDRQYPSVKVRRVHWGREGEVEYCFELGDLSDAQRMKFIRESKALLKTSRLVEVIENGRCRGD